ncbi:MAG: SDR family NAD(P)-dependent oxidoreductase [Myxococcota bacterium]
MSAPVTAIIGVGPGNGLSFARRFAAGGHRIALLSRSLNDLNASAEALEGEAMAAACDATQPDSVAEALATVESRFGPVDNLLYNAGSAAFGSVDQVDAETMEMAWRINTLGLFAAAKAVLPKMREKKAGSIIVTGATASLRGGARFAAFAQAKAAQRSLAQSLARQVGADGVHVSIVIVDGIVDSERTRERMPDVPADLRMNADYIAEAVWFLAHQAPSAWTFELDLRPSAEKW